MDQFLQGNFGPIITAVATIISFVASGFIFVYSLRGDINLFSQKMSMLHEQNVLRLARVEDELKILREVVIEQAKQEERLSIFERRFDKVLEHLKFKHADT